MRKLPETERCYHGKLCKQNDQLKDIIKRCGAELYVDKDGNYDAIIPMTPEEFEEFKRQIRERNK